MSAFAFSENSEEIQVVHYAVGQKYDSHHDWGVAGYPLSRYITLLLYLTDQPNPNAGGETAFPKGADGMGFKVLKRASDYRSEQVNLSLFNDKIFQGSSEEAYGCFIL